MALKDLTLERHGVSPETRSIVSSRVRIFATQFGKNSDGEATGLDTQIGLIASFDPSESRGMDPVRGVGQGDIIAEIVPSVTEPTSVSVTRTAMYISNIMQVFGYKAGLNGIVRSLRHHMFPFDVRQEIVTGQTFTDDAKAAAEAVTTSGAAAGGVAIDRPLFGDVSGVDTKVTAIVSWYVGCWMNSWSTSYTSDTYLVQESVDLTVTEVIGSSTNTPNLSDKADYTTIAKASGIFDGKSV